MKTLLTLIILAAAPAMAQFNSLDGAFNRLTERKNSLNASDLSKIQSGLPAVYAEIRQTGGLNIYVFKKVQAKPEEAAAVLTDYPLHKAYFESGYLEISDIIQSFSPTTDRVRYLLYINKFFGINEDYQTDYSVSLIGKDASAGFRVDRMLAVRGTRLKQLESSARFEPADTEGSSFVSYYSFMDFGFSITEEDAKTRILEIVKSLEAQVIKEVQTDRNLLNKQVEKLRSRFTSLVGAQ